MMTEQSALAAAFMKAVAGLQPSAPDVARHLDDLRRAHPTLSKGELASKWANSICWRFASQGAATALPSAIPGLGTVALAAIETGTISVELAYMLRCMAGLTVGVGMVYERDTEASFNQDFVRVLGLWCGVLTLGKEATARVASKIAIAQFNRVPAGIFKKINQRVGVTIVTKYGAKRGGIAVGRLIPFGVGALVGGTFNLATMKAFKRAAISYYMADSAVLFET